MEEEKMFIVERIFAEWRISLRRMCAIFTRSFFFEFLHIILRTSATIFAQHSASHATSIAYFRATTLIILKKIEFLRTNVV